MKEDMKDHMNDSIYTKSLYKDRKQIISCWELEAGRAGE